MTQDKAYKEALKCIKEPLLKGRSMLRPYDPNNQQLIQT